MFYISSSFESFIARFSTPAFQCLFFFTSDVYLLFGFQKGIDASITSPYFRYFRGTSSLVDQFLSSFCQVLVNVNVRPFELGSVGVDFLMHVVAREFHDDGPWSIYIQCP